jgi:hypothetical protein
MNMEHVWSKEIEEILRMGKPLFSVGVHNWALTKKEAMVAIQQLSSSQIPILGGDVYEIIDGVLQSNYDNWYCDPSSEETKIDFIKRSVAKAKEYIESYSVREPDKIFFVIVPGD